MVSVRQCVAAPPPHPVNGRGFVVPDHSVDSLADAALALGASGDLLAARRVARIFLAREQAGANPHPLATLVLTAALVHADSMVASPAVGDVVDVLRGLVADPTVGRTMATSRSQFAAYAAAELNELPREAREYLIDKLLSLVGGRQPRVT